MHYNRRGEGERGVALHSGRMGVRGGGLAVGGARDGVSYSEGRNITITIVHEIRKGKHAEDPAWVSKIVEGCYRQPGQGISVAGGAGMREILLKEANKNCRTPANARSCWENLTPNSRECRLQLVFADGPVIFLSELCLPLPVK